MDSAAHLDYASFQLTPTRTRCDLVIFYGGKSEKLASGLFQPFVSHLKSLKDEISRGGYSITLRPPTKGSLWFTKSTFQRFVRFVSTPAVLERFVNIEREILQIQSSVQLEEGNVSANCSTRKLTDSFQKKGELEEAQNVVENENSKARLQRLLETRIALLRKEQAMAYARGLVAGFVIHNIDDLFYFADAFGASRLREACINYKELYKKKHTDGLWIEELAAVVASSSSDLQFTGASGIVLANETNVTNQDVLLNLPNNASTPSTEKVQVPLPLPNQSPQYFYNFLGHTKKMPPYHGYPFPTMQSFPPHYPSNMQWPPNYMHEASCGKEPNYHRIQKSSSRSKKNFPNRKEPEYSGEGKQIESSDSTYGSGSDSDIQQERKDSSKKSRKKSSRKVVIQNINYITPKRRDGNKGGVSDESFPDEECNDGDSLKKKFEKAEELSETFHESNSQERDSEKTQCILNGSSSGADQHLNSDQVADASERGKKNENWNDFQSILMRDEHLTVNSVVPMDAQDEQFMVRRSEGANSLAARPTAAAAADPLAVIERNGKNEDRVKLEDFQKEGNFSSVMERKDCAEEEILFLQRSGESGTNIGGVFSTCAAESTITKSSRGEDWFIVNHSENTENQKVPIKQTDFTGGCIFSAVGKGTCTDDSFFIQTRSSVDVTYESPWKTDISMDTDLSLAAQKENGIVDIPQDNHGVSNTFEPDDLFMVLDRNSNLERDSNLESAAISWTMDYGAEISFSEANRRCSGIETTDGVEKKPASNCMNTNVKSNKVPGTRNPGKEARSNVLWQSLGNNRSDNKSKKASPASRPIIQKSKLEKEEEIRKKMEELMIQRQKRIAEKTAAGGFAPAVPKRVPLESKTAKGSIKSVSDKSKLHSHRLRDK